MSMRCRARICGTVGIFSFLSELQFDTYSNSRSCSAPTPTPTPDPSLSLAAILRIRSYTPLSTCLINSQQEHTWNHFTWSPSSRRRSILDEGKISASSKLRERHDVPTPISAKIEAGKHELHNCPSRSTHNHTPAARCDKSSDEQRSHPGRRREHRNARPQTR